MSDPVVGGIYLIRQAIRSPNYRVGLQGWTVNVDGSAEFNNVVIRGNLIFPDLNDILFYSSNPPALNTLLFAISPTAGSDIYGNTWGPGFSIFDGTHGSLVSAWGTANGFSLADPQNQFLNMTLTKVPLDIVSASFSGNTTAFLQAVNGLVTATKDTLIISSPTPVVATDTRQSRVALYLTESAALDGADGRMVFIDNVTGTTNLMHFTSTGVNVGTAFSVNGKTTLGDILSINSSDNAGSIFITQSVNTSTNPGTISQQETAATSSAYAVFVNGDAHARYSWLADGTHRWGPGTTSFDTFMARTGVGILAMTTGSFAIATAGQGFQVKEGANAKQGTAVLAGGTVTVANTSVTATSRIFLTAQTTGAAPGALRVSARVAGTSFTITSSSATDTSTVAYLIMEPA